jgi:uracil-DNA glycosylase
MRINKKVFCTKLPCRDVEHKNYLVPSIDIKLEDISIIMISEASPQDKKDHYYSSGDPLFQQTTVQAFTDAGIEVSSITDILDKGVYLTTAVKCGKTNYGIGLETIRECSFLLEKELELFTNVRAYLLMGDVSIRALNEIAKRADEPKVIPAGSTYKIRGEKYYYKGKRVFPSYLQAGPSYFIEKSKRRMIAEDISAAMKLLDK